MWPELCGFVLTCRMLGEGWACSWHPVMRSKLGTEVALALVLAVGSHHQLLSTKSHLSLNRGDNSPATPQASPNSFSMSNTINSQKWSEITGKFIF